MAEGHGTPPLCKRNKETNHLPAIIHLLRMPMSQSRTWSCWLSNKQGRGVDVENSVGKIIPILSKTVKNGESPASGE